MVLAVLIAPFLAVYAQRRIDLLREKHGRKLWVFKTLMATRSAKLSVDHVKALNMIDLEFQDKSPLEDKIRATWKEYLDHLGALTALRQEDKDRLVPSWSAKSDDYLADLLHVMGERLGYSFDKVHLRKAIYSPEGHFNDEMEARLIRRFTLQLLAGDRSISTITSVVPPNDEVARFATEYQSLLLSVLKGEQAVKIKQEIQG